MKTVTVKTIDGSKKTMSYEQLCLELGFNANAHFVRVTTQNTVSFYCGKPEEIRSLYAACQNNNFKVSNALETTVKRWA